MVEFIKEFLATWLEFYKIKQEKKHVCSSCETLKELLAAERFDKELILKNLLDVTNPKIEEKEEEHKVYKPVGPLPFRVRQQMLEQEDRATAKILRDKAAEAEALKKETTGTTIVAPRSIEELERELGVVEDASQVSEAI